MESSITAWMAMLDLIGREALYQRQTAVTCRENGCQRHVLVVDMADTVCGADITIDPGCQPCSLLQTSGVTGPPCLWVPPDRIILGIRVGQHREAELGLAASGLRRS